MIITEHGIDIPYTTDDLNAILFCGWTPLNDNKVYYHSAVQPQKRDQFIINWS